MRRRDFIKKSSALTAGIAITGISSLFTQNCSSQKMLFNISLAEWSLHRTLRSNDIDHLDFITLTRTRFNIDAVEYVNTFFFDKAKNKDYLNQMNQRASDHGIKNLLIMCDAEGDLGEPNDLKRIESVENHFKWVDAAKYLNCHSIRVNARSVSKNELSYEDQQKFALDGLQRLAEYGEKIGINIIVENHGGLSSNGKWLSEIMTMANNSTLGTLPDFGNFKIKDDVWYDRYKGVAELMPFAKAVSAKSHEFDSNGREINTDYFKMMEIVLQAGYTGYIGIEYEGTKHSEIDGIIQTRDLLKKIQNQLS